MLPTAAASCQCCPRWARGPLPAAACPPPPAAHACRAPPPPPPPPRQALFDLPRRMRAALEEDALEAAVDYYSDAAPLLQKYGSKGAFRGVAAEAEAAAKEAGATLKRRLAERRDDAERTVLLLRQLGEGDESLQVRRGGAAGGGAGAAAPGGRPAGGCGTGAPRVRAPMPVRRAAGVAERGAPRPFTPRPPDTGQVPAGPARAHAPHPGRGLGRRRRDGRRRRRAARRAAAAAAARRSARRRCGRARARGVGV
jgi:hypothetical protein